MRKFQVVTCLAIFQFIVIVLIISTEISRVNDQMEYDRLHEKLILILRPGSRKADLEAKLETLGFGVTSMDMQSKEGPKELWQVEPFRSHECIMAVKDRIKPKSTFISDPGKSDLFFILAFDHDGRMVDWFEGYRARFFSESQGDSSSSAGNYFERYSWRVWSAPGQVAFN